MTLCAAHRCTTDSDFASLCGPIPSDHVPFPRSPESRGAPPPSNSALEASLDLHVTESGGLTAYMLDLAPIERSEWRFGPSFHTHLLQIRHN